MRTIRITGTGSALPGRIVTNKELEQMVETSDEWIRERTGIGERHVSVGETVVTLASEAARKALEQAGKRAEEIDLILVATCSPEQYLPCCACQVQAAVGAVNALAFDVNAACSGFLFALNTADAYLRTGLAENAQRGFVKAGGLDGPGQLHPVRRRCRSGSCREMQDGVPGGGIQ